MAALLIGAASLWYTNKLVNKLSEEEYNIIQLWAEATHQARRCDGDEYGHQLPLSSVISNNNSIPVIWADRMEPLVPESRLTQSTRLDFTSTASPWIMRHDPIEIRIGQNLKQYILYRDSDLLIQYVIILTSSWVSSRFSCSFRYMAFSSSRKAEQNQVWVGMAKETAHQLWYSPSLRPCWRRSEFL